MNSIIIAHRCNSVNSVKHATRNGAMGIECDVRSIDNGLTWCVDHDGCFPWSTDYEVYLKEIKQFLDDITLFMFDLKTTTGLDELVRLAKIYIPAHVEIVVSFSSVSSFKESKIPSQVTVDVNFDDIIEFEREIQSVIELVPTLIVSFGTCVICLSGVQVQRSAEHALRTRNDKNYRVFVWTYDSEYSFNYLTLKTRVDGIIVTPDLLVRVRGNRG